MISQRVTHWRMLNQLIHRAYMMMISRKRLIRVIAKAALLTFNLNLS